MNKFAYWFFFCSRRLSRPLSSCCCSHSTGLRRGESSPYFSHSFSHQSFDSMFSPIVYTISLFPPSSPHTLDSSKSFAYAREQEKREKSVCLARREGLKPHIHKMYILANSLVIFIMKLFFFLSFPLQAYYAEKWWKIFSFACESVLSTLSSLWGAHRAKW